MSLCVVAWSAEAGEPEAADGVARTVGGWPDLTLTRASNSVSWVRLATWKRFAVTYFVDEDRPQVLSGLPSDLHRSRRATRTWGPWSSMIQGLSQVRARPGPARRDHVALELELVAARRTILLRWL